VNEPDPAAVPGAVPYRRWLAAIVGVQVLVAGWLAAQGGLFADDLLFMLLGKDGGLNYRYLTRSAYGHLTPAFLFITDLYGEWFGTTLWPAVIVMVGLCAIATVGFSLTMVGLVGRSRAALLATAWFALGPIVVFSVTWWSYSVTAFAGFAFSTWVVACAVRWERSRSVVDLVGVAVATLLSLSFWEKGFLTPIVIVALLALIVDGAARPRWERWRRRVPVLAVLAGATLPFFVVYVTGSYAKEAGVSPETSSLAKFMVLTVPEGLAPALAGFRYPYVGPGWLIPVAASVALVGFAIVTMVASRAAAPAWIFAAAMIIVNQGILGRGRVGLSGIHIGRDLRYQLDSAFAVCIAVGVAGHHLARRPPSWMPSPARWGRSLLIGSSVALLAMTVASVYTLTTSWDLVPGRDAGRYFDRVRRDWDTYADRDDGTWAILDGSVRSPFMLESSYPWNLWSRIAPLVDSSIRVGTSGERLLRVDLDGSLAPVTFAGSELIAAGVPTSDCTPGDAEVREFEVPEGHSGRYVEIELTGDHDAFTLTILDVDSGAPYDVRGLGTSLTVPAGAESVLVYTPMLGAGPLQLLSGDSSLGCVQRVSIGDIG